MNLKFVPILAVTSALCALPASAQFLLIPESTNDTVGMYDPFDGSYMGDLINGEGLFSTPINAVLGPDGYVYVSDQLEDAVFRFGLNGTYVDTFVSGYNNLRGIDFRGDHLFVTSGDDYVAEFDATGTFVGNFIDDGSDPFDIFFLDDGRSLLSDLTGDQVSLYAEDGGSYDSLFGIDFPEQIQYMASTGHYLNASFSADTVTEFGLDGTIYNQWTFDSGRGVFELGNGNLLVTNGDGVWALDPSDGGLSLIRGDISARYVEYVIPAPGSLALLVLAGFAGRRRR